MTKEREAFFQKMEDRRPKLKEGQKKVTTNFLPGANERLEKEIYGESFVRDKTPMADNVANWKDDDEKNE